MPPLPCFSRRDFLLLSAASLGALVVPGAAHARVDCRPRRGRALREELAAATAVFVGRLSATAASEPLATGMRGIPDAMLTFGVLEVLMGPVERGGDAVVRWRGFTEREDGPIVGGCRVPSPEEVRSRRVLVVAGGPADALVVENRSSSRVLAAGDRSAVREVRRHLPRRR